MLCIGKGKPETAFPKFPFSPDLGLQLPMWNLWCESQRVGDGRKPLLPRGRHRQTYVDIQAASRLWKLAKVMGLGPWRLLALVLKAEKVAIAVSNP